MKTHPAADIFPMMTDAEKERLRASIAEHGQTVPIKVLDGQILDGRNRYEVVTELGLKPVIETVKNVDDPIAHVMALNAERRHLTKSQLAMVAVKAKEFYASTAKARMSAGGGDRKSENRVAQKCATRLKPRKSAEIAAETLGVGTRSVEQASKVQDQGSNALKVAVSRGEIPVSDAAKLVDQVPSKKQQGEIIRGGKQAVKQALAGDKIKVAASKLTKTLEAALRAADDLHELKPEKAKHKDVSDYVKAALGRVW